MAQKPSSTALTSFTTFVKERFWHIVLVIALACFVLAIRNDLVQNDDLNNRSICFGFNAPANAICPTSGGGGMTITAGATAPVPLGYQTSGDGGYALVYVWSGAGTSDGGVCFAEVN